MWLTIGICLLAALLWPRGGSRRRTGADPLFKRTGKHWRRNYSRRSFLRLGGTMAAAGILAYSGLDEAVEGWHAGVVRSPGTDVAARAVKPLGERFWFWNWALLAAVDGWWRTSVWTRWGRKNFEAMIVGLPVLWTVQRGLGANRPESDDASPHWRPFQAAHSASGHAFIAGVAGFNLANRLPRPIQRGAARFGFMLTGWSRLNDRKHYVSQILLGWTIAFNAVEAVKDKDSEESETS